MVFIKLGPNRRQNEEEPARLQREHAAHLGKMYGQGDVDILGPFADDGAIRDITINSVLALKRRIVWPMTTHGLKLAGCW